MFTLSIYHKRERQENLKLLAFWIFAFVPVFVFMLFKAIWGMIKCLKTRFVAGFVKPKIRK